MGTILINNCIRILIKNEKVENYRYETPVLALKSVKKDI